MYKLILNLSFFILTINSFGQKMLYSFKDEFNNNISKWKLHNGKEWSSKIENGYFDMANETTDQYIYFRPQNNIIPKSVKYEITAKMIFNFTKSPENGGLIFIGDENQNVDGSYSTKEDDLRLLFHKYNNEFYFVLEGFGNNTLHVNKINFELKDNIEYTFNIKIDNSTNEDNLIIKIDDKPVTKLPTKIFNFNNIGFVTNAKSYLKVNSFEVKSFGGVLANGSDLFNIDFISDNNGRIIDSKYKSFETFEERLNEYIPKSLIKFYNKKEEERNASTLIEDITLDPLVKDYKIVENNNKSDIKETHCFIYKNNSNMICLPIFYIENGEKKIPFSVYASSNKYKMKNYFNLLSSLYNLKTIYPDDSIIIIDNDNWIKLYISNIDVKFWF